MPSYSSSQAVLAGPAQTFSPSGFVYGYVEVHNLGGSTMTVTFQGASYPLPASGRLAFDLSALNVAVSPANAVSVAGIGTVYVFFASEAPPVPILTANALGGGGGGVYTADNVTLQEIVANQFSIKNGGVGTAQLASDAVNEEKVAVNALQGFHVGGAINVSPPPSQQIALEWLGAPLAGDTLTLECSYGLAGTVVSQTFVYDSVVPGQITIPLATFYLDTVAAINTWASTLGAPFPVMARATANVIWYIFGVDINSISVNSSYVRLVGAIPTNLNFLLAGLANQLPTPQPIRVQQYIVSAEEAVIGYFLIGPGTQDCYANTMPAMTHYTDMGGGAYRAPTAGSFITVAPWPSSNGLLWSVTGTMFAGDLFVFVWGGINPAITPNPYP